MLGVLIEVHSEVKERSSRLARAISYAREAGGLLRGALREHARTIVFPKVFPLSAKEAHMRSEYKFPKATIGLMTVILAAVMLAIEKAKAISESVPPSSTFVGPIQPMHFSIVARIGVVCRSVRRRSAGLGRTFCHAPLWHPAFFGPESYRQPPPKQPAPVRWLYASALGFTRLKLKLTLKLTLSLRLPQTDRVAINIREPRKRSSRNLHRWHQRLASKRFRQL